MDVVPGAVELPAEEQRSEFTSRLKNSVSDHHDPDPVKDPGGRSQSIIERAS